MSIKWFKIAKSSLSINTPNRMLISVMVSIDMFCLLIQDENASQTYFVILQWKSKCLRDSSSFWQNVHNCDSIILKQNNLPLGYTISFSIFYWNSLIFVSTVTVNGKECIFSNHPQVEDIVFHLFLSRGRSLFFSFKLVIQ